MKDWAHTFAGLVGFIFSVWGGAYLVHVAPDWAQFAAILTAVVSWFAFGVYGWFYLGYAIGALHRN